MARIDDSGRRSATAWPQAVDLNRPTTALVYDYLIGGKDHRARDRVVGDRLIAAEPAVLRARENRAFLGRAVRYLAAEAGVPAIPRYWGRVPGPGPRERPRDRAGRCAGVPGGLRGQRPLQFGLCTRTLGRSCYLKRTRGAEALRVSLIAP